MVSWHYAVVNFQNLVSGNERMAPVLGEVEWEITGEAGERQRTRLRGNIRRSPDMKILSGFLWILPVGIYSKISARPFRVTSYIIIVRALGTDQEKFTLASVRPPCQHLGRQITDRYAPGRPTSDLSQTMPRNPRHRAKTLLPPLPPRLIQSLVTTSEPSTMGHHGANRIFEAEEPPREDPSVTEPEEHCRDLPCLSEEWRFSGPEGSGDDAWSNSTRVETGETDSWTTPTMEPEQVLDETNLSSRSTDAFDGVFDAFTEADDEDWSSDSSRSADWLHGDGVPRLPLCQTPYPFEREGVEDDGSEHSQTRASSISTLCLSETDDWEFVGVEDSVLKVITEDESHGLSSP